jgi:hypothetical protein
VILRAAGHDFAEHLEAKDEAVAVLLFSANFGHNTLNLADHVLNKLEIRRSLFVFDHDGVLVDIILLLLDLLSEFVFLNCF